MTDKELMDDLNKWSTDVATINPLKDFECAWYKECNSSIGETLNRGNTCLMSYVGRQYGDGTQSTFRLAIVGMEHRSYDPVGSYEDRRDGIESYYQVEKHDFNQHYRGVVKTAAAFLGAAGKFCETNCVKKCARAMGMHADGISECVLEKIAQPNMVKCAPEEGNASSKSSNTMKANCANHLVNELRILKPHLVIFHGVAAEWAFPQSVRREGTELIPLSRADSTVPASCANKLFNWAERDCYVLFLHHPSRGCLGRQWQPIVLPCLEYLRQRKIIPID